MLIDAPYIRRGRAPRAWIEDPGHWPTLKAAYDAVRAGMAEPVAAWKLGGTNAATRTAFGIDHLYFGPLFAAEILPHGGTLRAPMLQCQVEIEIALRIGQTGPDAWCFAAELPVSALRDPARAGIAALVADRCGAGALVLGPEYAIAPGDWPGEITLCIDGRPAARGNASVLLSDPAIIARDFIARAGNLGFAPEPGQWIATGGLTPCIPIPRRGQISITIDGKPEFTFQTEVPENDAP